MITGPTIYKRDTQGRLRTWFYEVDGDRYRTISGLHDGERVTSGWTVCTPKSQPTAEAQAEFEAKAEMRKKLDRIYRVNPELLDGPMMFEPMLAKKFEGFPGRCYSQPKLDGIRCIATGAGLFSRQGKKFTGLPHIEEALAPIFEKYEDLVLDGELYNHDFREDFEKIVSAVRKRAGHPDAPKVQYHIYDMATEHDFGARCWDLSEIIATHTNSSCLVVVPTSHVGAADLLDQLYAEYMANGFEGQMVRLDAAYENKRSRHLLKRKEFDDHEYRIVDIVEGLGNWAGYAKSVLFELPDGRHCSSGLKANRAHARHLLEKKQDYAGGTVTIRHFGFTNDGMPRFPVATTLYTGARDL